MRPGPAPGDRLGDYLVDRPLGAGGMGAVYAARDLRLDRAVALKLLAPGLAAPPDAASRLADEAAAAAKAKHPGLVPILDVGVDPAHGPYLAFELLPGATLRTRLAGSGPLPPEALVEALARPLCGALAALHGAGVIHRDVKPENLFLDHDGRYRLGDLGLAFFASRQARTATGILVGTPGYLAPEILEGNPPGPAADLFAAALVLVEAAAGGLPWKARDPAQLLLEVARRSLGPADLETLGLERETARLLARYLGRDPATRPRDPAALAAALESLPRLRAPVQAPPAQGPRSAETRRLSNALTPAPQRTGPRPAPGRPWARLGPGAALALGAAVLLFPRAPGPAASPPPEPDPASALIHQLVASAGPEGRAPDPAAGLAAVERVAASLGTGRPGGSDPFSRVLAALSNPEGLLDDDPDPDWVARTRAWLDPVRAAARKAGPGPHRALADGLLLAWAYALPAAGPEAREALLVEEAEQEQALPIEDRVQPAARARVGLRTLLQALALAEAGDRTGLAIMAPAAELFARSPLVLGPWRHLARGVLAVAARTLARARPLEPSPAGGELDRYLPRWLDPTDPAPAEAGAMLTAMAAEHEAASRALGDLVRLERDLDAKAFLQAGAIAAGRPAEAAGTGEARAYVTAVGALLRKRSLVMALRPDPQALGHDYPQLARGWIWAFTPQVKTTWPHQELAKGLLLPCYPAEASADQALLALLSFCRWLDGVSPESRWLLRAELLGLVSSYMGEIAAYRKSRLPGVKARIEAAFPGGSGSRRDLLAHFALRFEPQDPGAAPLHAILVEDARAAQGIPAGAKADKPAWDGCQIAYGTLWRDRRERKDWTGAAADGRALLEALRPRRVRGQISPDQEFFLGLVAVRTAVALSQLKDADELRRLGPDLLWTSEIRAPEVMRTRASRLLAGEPVRPDDV